MFEDKLATRKKPRTFWPCWAVREEDERGGAGQSAVAVGQSAVAVNQAGRSQNNDLQRFSLVNLLYVPGEQQVVLKVRIAELTRSAARSLSMDLKLGDAFNFASGGGNVTAILNGGDVELFLRAFSTNGYGKLLAEPTLVTLCGAEVDVIDSNGCTSLFYATTLGHADSTQLLLSFGAEPNRQDRKGRT